MPTINLLTEDGELLDLGQLTAQATIDRERVGRISTYAELQAAGCEWLEDRDDLIGYMPAFIALAEGYLSAELRVREMEASTLMTPVDGVTYLPQDLIEVINITGKGNGNRSLQCISGHAANDDFPFGSAGIAQAYSLVGSTIQLYPATTSGVRIHYYAEIPQLGDGLNTNWLLAKRPELYLRATLMQAAEFIKQNEEAAKHKALVDMMISQMNRIDAMSRGRKRAAVRGVTP